MKRLIGHLRTRAGEQSGFSIIEVVVAMFIVVVALVGLAGALAGAAKVNRTSSDRQRALETASGIIDQWRSVPFTSVKMPLAGAGNDAGRDQVDWRRTFCPVSAYGGCTGGMVVSATSSDPSSLQNPNGDGPNVSKRGDLDASGAVRSEPNSTVRKWGSVAYTYVTWGLERNPLNRCDNPSAVTPETCPRLAASVAQPSPRVCEGSAPISYTKADAYRPACSHKLITVMVRYRDPAGLNPGSSSLTTDEIRRVQSYSTVRLTTAIVDTPGLDLETINPDE